MLLPPLCLLVWLAIRFKITDRVYVGFSAAYTCLHTLRMGFKPVYTDHLDHLYTHSLRETPVMAAMEMKAIHYGRFKECDGVYSAKNHDLGFIWFGDSTAKLSLSFLVFFLFQNHIKAI